MTDAHQLAAHRHTALARALQRDIREAPLTAPTGIPAGLGTTTYIVRAAAPGAGLAAELEARHAAVVTMHWRLVRAMRSGSVDDIIAAGERLTELEARRDRLAAELAGVDGGRSRPPGGAYLIEVPPFGDHPGETYRLDPATLPDSLRERLRDYLHSGSDCAPYFYRPARKKYTPNERAPEDTRVLLREIWGHTVRIAVDTCTPATAQYP